MDHIATAYTVPPQGGKLDGDKPAMGRDMRPSSPVPGEAAQGLRPVDPEKPSAKRPPPFARGAVSNLPVRIGAELRGHIAAAAKRDGLTDSAWLRQAAIRVLGLDGEGDRLDLRRRRIAPADQAALAGAMRDIGEASIALRHPQPKIAEALAGLQRAREAVIPVIVGFEGRAT